jgi:hypothetical protein
MTELPTLQAAIREAAERTYPRRRRRAVIPALLVAAAAAAALLVIDDRDARGPAGEVTATPTVRFTPTPTPYTSPRLPSNVIPPIDPRELRATPVDPHDPALKDATSLMNPASVVVKAWFVPGLKGHVLLTRNGDEYCFSAPDPLSDQPDVERGSTCAPPERRAKHGDYIGIGNVVITLAPGADTPKIRQR